jgi:uncharacterized 2Fe-2S/4Fe-4S cluster protein (DUF4445 family)
MKIRFLPKGLEYTFETGKSVLKLAAEAGAAIDGNCAGNGTCGKCKVKVISGNDEKISREEKLLLSAGEIRAGYRLACKFRPINDVIVEVPLEEDAVKRKTKLMAMPDSLIIQNGYKKQFVRIEESTIQNQASDLEKIKKNCGLDERGTICSELIKKIPDLLSEKREITVTARQNEIIDIEAGDATTECYGLALDIGTTTVVGHLWNLITGELIGVNAVTNPQGVFGADVISRITYANESKENLENIHQKIIACINGIASEFSETYHVKLEHIYEITFVGNTTMSHLLLGVNPRQLAVAPFAPVFVKSVAGLASELGIRINKNAKYYLMPIIAGHVGSDITAGILSTGIMHGDGIHLMLDVGTNGEIVLTGRGSAITCSTAAGPAFEGASIFKGMRAAEGAIEKIKIEDDVRIQVIGSTVPTGICGSGIIDAVAQLINSGLVDWTGKFIKPEAMIEKNIPESIISRFRKSERGNEFVLAYNSDGEDIVILQKDIREVQLAKAAIYAGIRILMNRMGITDDDLDKIHIAGAFGNYIDIDSALTIGLLPKIDKDKIISEGNSAGIGACMALLFSDKQKEAERTAETVIHVELASCTEFQDEYVKSMSF